MSTNPAHTVEFDLAALGRIFMDPLTTEFVRLTQYFVDHKARVPSVEYLNSSGQTVLCSLDEFNSRMRFVG